MGTCPYFMEGTGTSNGKIITQEDRYDDPMKDGGDHLHQKSRSA